MAMRVCGMVDEQGHPRDCIDGQPHPLLHGQPVVFASPERELHQTLDHQMVEMAKIVNKGSAATSKA